MLRNTNQKQKIGDGDGESKEREQKEQVQRVTNMQEGDPIGPDEVNSNAQVGEREKPMQFSTGHVMQRISSSNHGGNIRIGGSVTQIVNGNHTGVNQGNISQQIIGSNARVDDLIIGGNVEQAINGVRVSNVITQSLVSGNARIGTFRIGGNLTMVDSDPPKPSAPPAPGNRK